MKRKPLGNSQIVVSEIGFGCMSLSTQASDEATSLRLLERALELGVTFFDTADLYDQGRNESLVGRAFRHCRDKVILASKVGNRWNDDGTSWRWDASPEWIREAVERSLKRLNTDYLDLYQLHGGTLDDPIEDIIASFETLKQQGLIRAYGISSIRPNVIREWAKCSSMSSVMMQYSLLDRRPEESCLDFLQQQGISVIARGPVAKGYLATKPPQDYLDYHQNEVQEVQEKLQALVTAKRSAAQLALRYALAQPVVATVIPGASSLQQLEENVAAAYTPLSERELEQLRQISKAGSYQNHR